MSDDDFARRASGVGALADPVRRALYRLVVAVGGVSRDQAAEALGLPAHVARFQLERLVTEGLLVVEHRRLTGRSGPGAGRPAKVYRRADVEVAVSLPERRYELAGDVMAEAIESAVTSGDPVDRTLADAAARRGRELAARVAARADGGLLPAVVAALAEQGYEPRVEGGEVTLANCPFHALAREHTALVCGMNLDLLTGLGDAVAQDSAGGAEGGPAVRVRLEPAEGRCCVVLSVETPSAPARPR